MKQYLKHLSIALTVLVFTSCVIDDDVVLGDITGPNLASFAQTSKVISGIANGEEYENEIVLEVKGPTVEEMTGDVEVTVSVDPASTAIEGTHFSLDSKTITLQEENNYIGKLPITLLTEGIVAPLDESPVLILNVESATGQNVINNGKPLTIDLNYLCNSTLAGNYQVEGRYVYPSQGIDQTFTYTDVLTETGTGEYRSAMVGHWGDLGVGNPGFTFFDICNRITIPEQNLVDYYSNLVKGVAGQSSVNPETGVITMEYTICASGACREYYITYTPIN